MGFAALPIGPSGMCALAVRGLVCHDLAATPPDLLLLREEDPVTVSLLVGHARASMPLDVYGHVHVDEVEVNYQEVLE